MKELNYLSNHNLITLLNKAYKKTKDINIYYCLAYDLDQNIWFYCPAIFIDMCNILPLYTFDIHEVNNFDFSFMSGDLMRRFENVLFEKFANDNNVIFRYVNNDTTIFKPKK